MINNGYRKTLTLVVVTMAWIFSGIIFRNSPIEFMSFSKEISSFLISSRQAIVRGLGPAKMMKMVFELESFDTIFDSIGEDLQGKRLPLMNGVAQQIYFLPFTSCWTEVINSPSSLYMYLFTTKINHLIS